MILLLLGSVSLSSCARKGLLSERFEEEYYSVPKLAVSDSHANPKFLAYGDCQASWMIQWEFLSRENWHTWKIALFPFYEIYKLGYGTVGLINRLRMVPDGGRKTRLMMRNILYSEYSSGDIDFILSTGDVMGSDGRRPHHWSIFLDEYKHEHNFLNEIPFVPTCGNHERPGDREYGLRNFEAVFNYPQFFTLVYQDVEIFVISTSMIIDWRDDIEDSRQDSLFTRWFVSDDETNPGWLENKLKQSDKAFKMVSMHHCPLSFAKHWKDWYKSSYGNDLLEKRRKLIDLFSESGVQVVFSGHDHIFQRITLQIDEEIGHESREINFVITSGGGTLLRHETKDSAIQKIESKYRDEGYNITGFKQLSKYHYTEVDVSEDRVEIITYGVDEDTNQPDGLIDSFYVEKN